LVVPALSAGVVGSRFGAAPVPAAGAVGAAGVSELSRIDVGADVRADISCMMNARPRKIPAPHHVTS
jgi:hypothetical protein